MFVCLFVCPIITHDSLDRFASNCDKVTRNGMLLTCVYNAKLCGLTFTEKV